MELLACVSIGTIIYFIIPLKLTETTNDIFRRRRAYTVIIMYNIIL